MKQILEIHRDQFTLCTDPSRLDMKAVYDFLARAYWSRGRPRERTDEAFANSLVFGLYQGERQIGLARVVTDYSIIAYLCDVFIHEEYRVQGLGRWLVESVLAHPDLKDVRRWLLVTEDAHGLYQKYDFTGIDHVESWMQRLRPFPGEQA